MNEKINDSDCVLVAFNPSNGIDNCVLLVGRRGSRGGTDIINAFQGPEAKELYEKLVTKKEKENG